MSLPGNESEADVTGEVLGDETTIVRRPTEKPKQGRPPSTQRRNPKSFKTAGFLANSDALATAEKAAAAVGCTVEELGNLFVDGGLTALPPSDPITESYTMKELGERLWVTMVEEKKTERMAWFAGLVEVQQIAVVVTFRDRGFAAKTIADDLGITQMIVMRMWAKHCDQLGAQVVGVRLNTIAGQMQMAAERAQEMSIEKKDGRTYWSVEQGKIKMLQELGVIDKAKHRIEVTHKVEGEQEENVRALLELERKKLRRAEEIKQIEAAEIDEVPEMEEEGWIDT